MRKEDKNMTTENNIKKLSHEIWEAYIEKNIDKIIQRKLSKRV